jgi:HAD superfamily hydrolase (TIGR01450 family)
MPMFDRSFKSKKIIFLDLDGTVYIGNTLIPGAKTFLDYLSFQSIDYFFLSNNSSRSKKDYVKKLSFLGIPTTEEQIILSTDGVIDFLLNQHVKKVFVVGTRSMREMFTKAGLDSESEHPDYVVLGYDTEITYDKLKKAAIFLQNGVKFLATHCDIVCPTPEGPVPDVGAMLALFEKATGKRPVRIFGKPNADMVNHILKKHAASPDEVVLIGDRIYTDMELANRLNCDFILVLSGETQPSDLPKLTKQPALIVDSLGYILP